MTTSSSSSPEPAGNTDASAPAPARNPVNNLLIIVILVLLGQIAWQQSKLWALEGQVSQATRAVDDRAAKIAQERMQGRREDLVRAVDWLQQYYRSEDGLKRPNGLWIAEQSKVDAEAIGVWVFDVYMNRRVAGASEEEARKAVMDAIQGTDEWKRGHGK